MHETARMSWSGPLSSSRRLMWTAPEMASAICSTEVRPVAPLMSALSRVRSLLVVRPPEDLQHDRAVPARHRALPPSRCSRGWKAVCPATPETCRACPRASAPRQPTVPVDCADRQAGDTGQPPAASPAYPRQLSCAAPCRPRIARRGSRPDRRGVVVLASGVVSRDASRVQWVDFVNR
jgi:hypothetical protein